MASAMGAGGDAGSCLTISIRRDTSRLVVGRCRPDRRPRREIPSLSHPVHDPGPWNNSVVTAPLPEDRLGPACRRIDEVWTAIRLPVLYTVLSATLCIRLAYGVARRVLVRGCRRRTAGEHASCPESAVAVRSGSSH